MSGVAVLVVAAGKGERAGGSIPKQYAVLAGKPVLRWTLEAFSNHSRVASIQVAIAPEHDRLYAATDRGNGRRVASEQEREYVLSGARCMLWYANVTHSDHPDQLFWDACFVDPEAAQRFLPLEMLPGESYADARYRARLPDRRRPSRDLI